MATKISKLNVQGLPARAQSQMVMRQIAMLLTPSNVGFDWWSNSTPVKGIRSNRIRYWLWSGSESNKKATKDIESLAQQATVLMAQLPSGSYVIYKRRGDFVFESFYKSSK